jgi:hypothetical protein
VTQHGAIAETEISYSSAEGKIPCRIDLNQRREVTKIIKPTPDTNTIRAKRSVNFKIMAWGVGVSHETMNSRERRSIRAQLGLL